MALSIFRFIIAKLSYSHRTFASADPFGLVPQEVLDLIIAYLADDKVTLLSCALVHPTWTSISRYHLPPLTLVVSSPSRSRQLTSLLRSSRETLSTSIVGITLIGDVPFDDSAKSSCAQSYHKLFQLLKAKHVALDSGAVENDPLLVRLFAQYFPALTELKVTCASYQDITNFMRALSGSFPRLSGLSIELGSSGMDVPDASLSGLRHLALGMPVLRALRVTGWNNDLMQWLGINVLGTLERLELENSSVWSSCRVEEVYPLLLRNKQMLKDLKLNFMHRTMAFDLSDLMRLQYLEITGSMTNTLHGGMFPRSLERIFIRDATCTRAPLPGVKALPDQPEECILLEGQSLQMWLGKY